MRSRIRQQYIDAGDSPIVADAKAAIEINRQFPSRLASYTDPTVAEKFEELPASAEEARRSMPTMSPKPEPIADRRETPFYPDAPVNTPTDNYQPGGGTMATRRGFSSLGYLLTPRTPLDQYVPPETGGMDPFGVATGMPMPANAPASGTPTAMPERGYAGDSPRERIAVTAANDIIARQREAADSGLLDRANFNDENAVPNPQRAKMPLPVRRPAALDQQPAPQQSLLGRIFSGQDYQSSNALASDPRLAGYNAKVVQDGNINWGDRDSAADFFRADKAMMAQREAAKKDEEDTGKAKGGAVAGKDAAIHKALEIIHHLLTRGH
jgi:hypothetical protein